MNRTSLLLFPALLLAAPAFAQEAPGDIIVTATGAPQAADTTGEAITVVTGDDLQQRQTVSLADYLATTPGVSVTRNGGAGTVTSLRIRGAEAEQTLVLIDGVRVNDPSSPGGAFDFASLLTGSIARVEVLRGANSVPWGSQAIGGVVNMVTEQAPDRGVVAHASGEYGAFETGYLNGGIAGRSGAVSGAIDAGYFTSKGISAAASGTEPDGYRRIGGSARLGIDLTDNIGVDLRGYYAHGRTDLDGYPPPTYAFADTGEYSKAQEIYGYAGVHANLAGGRFRNRVAFTIADINRDNYDPALGTAPSFIGRGRSERYEYRGDFRVSDGARIVAGADHENSRFYDGATRASVGITSVYGELIVQPFRALTVTGGVRHDDHRAFGGHTTFGANAALALGEGTILRGSYSEGFKAPTLYQLYGAYGTAGLRPETARGYDVGVEQSLLDGRARIGATWFHRDTANQIDFDLTRFTYANIARARAEGVEVALTLRPVDGFVVQANYSRIIATNRAPGANYGNDLARRPRDLVNLSVDYRFDAGPSIGATVQVVGDSFNDAGNFTRLDGYALASVRAEAPFAHRFALFGRVENLFDAKYTTVAGYGTPGRAGYIGVRIRFD